jgi:hypothetical protein
MHNKPQLTSESFDQYDSSNLDGYQFREQGILYLLNLLKTPANLKTSKHHTHALLLQPERNNFTIDSTQGTTRLSHRMLYRFAVTLPPLGVFVTVSEAGTCSASTVLEGRHLAISFSVAVRDCC